MPVHTTKICCFESRYLKFLSGYLENLLLCIFEKDCEFFDQNASKHLPKFQQHFVENSPDETLMNFVCITFAQY